MLINIYGAAYILDLFFTLHWDNFLNSNFHAVAL